jgi:hypothetical protein
MALKHYVDHAAAVWDRPDATLDKNKNYRKALGNTKKAVAIDSRRRPPSGQDAVAGMARRRTRRPEDVQQMLLSSFSKLDWPWRRGPAAAAAAAASSAPPPRGPAPKASLAKLRTALALHTFQTLAKSSAGRCADISQLFSCDVVDVKPVTAVKSGLLPEQAERHKTRRTAGPKTPPTRWRGGRGSTRGGASGRRSPRT